MVGPVTRARAHRANRAAVDAVFGCQALVSAITAFVDHDDRLAWSLVCRACREAQVVAGGGGLFTRGWAYGASVERALWAHGLGAPVEGLQRAAAACGSVAVLRWSVEEAGCPIPADGYGFRLYGDWYPYSICDAAAKAGSVEALAYLRVEWEDMHGGCCWP